MFGYFSSFSSYFSKPPEPVSEPTLESKLPDSVVKQTVLSMKQFKPTSDSIVVIGDVDALDTLWKNSSTYITPFCSNCKSSKAQAKFINSKKDMIKNDVKIPPQPYIDDYSKPYSLEFTNGRNRFANLRDSGIKEIPILIEKSQIDKFKEHDVIIRMVAGKRQPKRKHQTRRKPK